MAIVAGLSGHVDAQRSLLQEFVRFVVQDDRSKAQLWTIGRSYTSMKSVGYEKELISPLVAFQVRGSVAASGGHEPEELLRSRLTDWGLTADVDFNSSDAIAFIKGDSDGRPTAKAKTRAFDFILPFRTPQWAPTILIQCQFYAGDSGSVSHKNVDQTKASRDSVRAAIPNAQFVEYVDGAGYYSSLNGDLRSLLAMETTSSFFQVRSASVRLRRELQVIGFLSGLEIEHAVLVTGGSPSSVESYLRRDGYSPKEIDRSISANLSEGRLTGHNEGALSVSEHRRDLARRYVLLDLAACHGTEIKPGKSLRGLALIPGYGPFYGLPPDELARIAIEAAPALKEDWSSPDVILADIRWLQEQGMMVSG
jgi:hypothetical protein